MLSRVHTLRRSRDLGGGTFALEVDGPIPETLPGQFFMLRTATRWPVQLPRPFSLYDRAADGSWGSFLVKPIPASSSC
jgi:NAD(P)H-flavin reductase